jgi:hypothetical protein
MEGDCAVMIRGLVAPHAPSLKIVMAFDCRAGGGGIVSSEGPCVKVLNENNNCPSLSFPFCIVSRTVRQQRLIKTFPSKTRFLNAEAFNPISGGDRITDFSSGTVCVLSISSGTGFGVKLK